MVETFNQIKIQIKMQKDYRQSVYIFLWTYSEKQFDCLYGGDWN
jgi:hypothetical protein